MTEYTPADKLVNSNLPSASDVTGRNIEVNNPTELEATLTGKTIIETSATG
jgi:hypothetical protein